MAFYLSNIVNQKTKYNNISKLKPNIILYSIEKLLFDKFISCVNIPQTQTYNDVYSYNWFLQQVRYSLYRILLSNSKKVVVHNFKFSFKYTIYNDATSKYV